MTTIYDLPEPGNQFKQRSEALSECIRQKIHAQHAAISFAEFMGLALYHPEFGYYNTNTFDIGEHGDFTTAPEISSLFAKCLAAQIHQIITEPNLNHVLELGAGTGRLAGDILNQLTKLKCLPEHYFIYEISPALRKKQQTYLQSTCPDYFSNIIWLDNLPENFSGMIIANEVLDALPFHCFSADKNTVKERCVNWNGNEFVWELCQPSSPQLLNYANEIKKTYLLADGYEFEINMNIQIYLQSLSRILSKGIILFSDYGYGQREYYHPERKHGTLSCFYQHKRHDNPLILPGLQDITAHVDFTNLIDKAVDYGFSLAGYTSQTSFLLACGLADFVAEDEKKIDSIEKFKLHHAVKLLTMPTEMGERVKFMGLSKDVELALLGFKLQDRRRDL